MSDLWHNTIGYGATGPKLPYLSDEENCRVERMRVARMLWKGHHRHAFLHEHRTQFDFPEMEIQGTVRRPYVTFNVLKLVTNTFTDLLLGEEPSLTIDDTDGQGEIDALKTRSDVDRVLYDAVKAASWSSEGMVEIIRWDGEVYVRDVKPSELFPQGELQPDGQFPSYKRYATAMTQESGGLKPRRLLLESTYLPGEITRACYFLSDTSSKTTDADLALWPTADGAPLSKREPTGIDWNTLVWMGNEIDEGCPTSDYDGLIELQDELNAKQTQLARVIALHADPAMGFPASAFDAQGNIHANRKAFAFRSKDDLPAYVVWDAQLAAAMEDRDSTLNSLCMVAELSQGLMGLEKGGAPDSARKLRLQATRSLARVKRKAKFVKPFIRTAVDTALMMVRAGRVVKVAMGGAGMGGGSAVDLRDGLPVDDLDQANVISILTGGKATMSVESGVAMRIGDPEAQKKELGLLKQEAEAAAPTVTIGQAAPEVYPGNATQSAGDGVTSLNAGGGTGGVTYGGGQ